MKNLFYKINKEVTANFQFGSSNSKTGDSVQIWFIPNSMVENGGFNVKLDSPVCFDCPFSKGRGCYVAKGFSRMGLNSKIKSMSKGISYSSEEDILSAIEGKFVRFGAYGEPVLLPLDFVEQISAKSNNWTGYTHQWRKEQYQPYQKYFMASVHTVEEAMFAEALGWRWFMSVEEKHWSVFYEDEQVTTSVYGVNCPASKESGRKTTCSNCALCKGTSSNAKSVWIFKH